MYIKLPVSNIKEIDNTDYRNLGGEGYYDNDRINYIISCDMNYAIDP